MSTKIWVNPWTEVESLGNDAQGQEKFRATVRLGRQAFKDKSDGKWKQRKLTNNLPDHAVLQSARCCVEVYPYYAKIFDVDHEEVRVEEERWAVQRLFKEPDTWRDVGAWNPVMSVEETADAIIVSITYETDYGHLTIKYIQQDGHDLKRDIHFINASGGAETFRVIQSLSGINADKVNRKEIVEQEESNDEVLKFSKLGEPVFIQSFRKYGLTKDQEAEKGAIEWVKHGECNHCGKCCTHYKCPYYVEEAPHCTIYERRPPACRYWPYNPRALSMIPECTLTLEPSGEKYYPTKLRARLVSTHPKGLKADIEYGVWMLQPDELFEIDPESATIYDTNDSYTAAIAKGFGGAISWMRFDISEIVADSTIDSAILNFTIHSMGANWDDDLYIARIVSQDCDPENDEPATLLAYEVSDDTLYEDIDSTGLVSKDWATPLAKDVGETYHSIRIRDPDISGLSFGPYTATSIPVGELIAEGNQEYIYIRSDAYNGDDPYLSVEYTLPSVINPLIAKSLVSRVIIGRTRIR